MANKPQWQKPTDADVEAMKEIYRIAEEKTEIKYQEILTNLKQKLSAAPWLYEMAGKIKATKFNKAQAEFFTLIMLKEVKDNKDYRDKFNMTWEEFCEYCGISRRRLDEELQDLKSFKAEFLADFASFLGYEIHKIKYLGEAISAESASFSGNSITYLGNTIPLTPEHRDDIQALLEKLEESYKSQIEEKDTTIRTKDKLLSSKDDLLKKQEKDLHKFEKEAERKGLTLEEDAFIQKMENLRIGFDGYYMLGVDPDRVPELKPRNGEAPPTKRMIAAYLTTLDYMRKQILAAYDTAQDIYGSPVMTPERAWHPGMKVV